MRLLFYSLLLLGLSFSATGGAQKASNKSKPRATASTSANKDLLKVWTVHGDRVAQWSVKTLGRHGELHMVTSGGSRTVRTLSREDMQFLLGEAQKLPSSPKIPAECQRARMSLEVNLPGKKPQIKSSCFGLPTKTSPQYVRFANILMMAL